MTLSPKASTEQVSLMQRHVAPTPATLVVVYLKALLAHLLVFHGAFGSVGLLGRALLVAPPTSFQFTPTTRMTDDA